MNYETLFKAGRDRTVRAAIAGAGEFGTSFIFQSRFVPGLDVPAVIDRVIERGVNAFLHVGWSRDDVVVCENPSAAKAALEAGRRIVVNDVHAIAGLPIDVFVEGTGNPEAGARNGAFAIDNGWHLVMVTKESDSIVGPVLSARARRASLIYTSCEGDQPSLLIGLISWARVLGLDILAVGKSSEYDFVFDPRTKVVTSLDRSIEAPGLDLLWDVSGADLTEIVAARAELLSALPQHAVPDLTEMGHVANATGFKPDAPAFHAPIARGTEISNIFCPASMGGIFSGAGVIDVVNFLRRPDDASLAGGVFVVVACKDAKTWEVLRGKGHEVSRNGACAMIYHPAHLLGVEAPISVLSAALLGQATGGEELRPVCDLIGRTNTGLKAGTALTVSGHHHTIDGVEGLLVDAVTLAADHPVPFYLAADCRLKRDVPAGTVLTLDMIEEPPESVLWQLRREQDATFAAGA